MTPAYLRVLFVLLLVCSSVLANDPAAAALRVMSFNIRYSTAKDGENQWANRKEQVVSTIRKHDPDLIGFQEVLAEQFDYLVETFPDYKAVGVARDDGARKGEWSAVFYRKNRFDESASGTFWLSEEPKKPGTFGWDAVCVRICSWAKLQDRKAKKEFLFANTHFDHQGQKARLESAKLLRRHLPELARGTPIILAGDFNCTETSAPYKVLTATAEPDTEGEIQFLDSYRRLRPERSGEEATYHGFKGVTAGLPIDWILHTPELRPKFAEVIRSNIEGRYPSDHYPVFTVLEWNNASE